MLVNFVYLGELDKISDMKTKQKDKQNFQGSNLVFKVWSLDHLGLPEFIQRIER